MGPREWISDTAGTCQEGSLVLTMTQQSLLPVMLCEVLRGGRGRPGLGPRRHRAVALLGALCWGCPPQPGGALAFSGSHAQLYLTLPGAKPLSALAVCPTALEGGVL